MRMRRAVRLLLGFGMACAALGGCATPPPESDPEALADFKQTNDPLEPTNRKIYAANEAVDKAVLQPVARGYRAITPQPVRESIHNVLTNLTTPVLLGNDMLEGKPRRAGDSLMRFLINSTAGVAGIFDVATDWGYPAHESKFGTTLALWGVDEGPFLELPVLGPSNPRDAFGFGVDTVTDPVTWVTGGAALTAATWGRTGANAVDQRERNLDTVEDVKKTALDPYATFRSLYRQHRESQVEDTRAADNRTIPVWFDQPSK
jgi:phospholipid-binding lipoprotein MlaA